MGSPHIDLVIVGCYPILQPHISRNIGLRKEIWGLFISSVVMKMTSLDVDHPGLWVGANTGVPSHVSSRTVVNYSLLGCLIDWRNDGDRLLNLLDVTVFAKSDNYGKKWFIFQLFLKSLLWLRESPIRIPLTNSSKIHHTKFFFLFNFLKHFSISLNSLLKKALFKQIY